MTIKALLHKNKLLLKKHNIISFQIDAELLLCFVLKKKREYLLTNDNENINFLNSIKYTSLIKQRIKGYSVAVIIGHKSFYGKDFLVNKRVLIPRPETEMMVDEALTILNSKENNFNVIDIGTGSACIITSIATTSNKEYNNYIAIDISRKALQIAKKNIKKHQLTKTIQILEGNLLTPLLKNNLIRNNRETIITANLPYLTKNQVKNSPTIQREPKLALIAEEEGLQLYRKLFKQIHKLEKLNHKKIHLLCEIDPSQSIGIKKLQKDILSDYSFKIKKDLTGADRLIIINNM